MWACLFDVRTPTPRLALQGIPPAVRKYLSPEKALQAAGNAFPVPFIIATLHPMLCAVATELGQLPKWDASSTESSNVCMDQLEKFLAAVRKPGRIIDHTKIQATKDQAPTRARALKRKRDERRYG